MAPTGGVTWRSYAAMSDETPITSYRSLTGEGTGLYSELRSRFISRAVPVTSVEEAMAVVEEERAKYHDARHCCWAYVVGIREREERCNDDGEPSSTAGKPILGRIHALELTNVVVTVVRYFGGKLLGTSGLIVAYREAARLALEDAPIEETLLRTTLTLRFPYDRINPVMMLLRDHEVETLDSTSDLERYIWQVAVEDARLPLFLEAARSLYYLRMEPDPEEQTS